MGDPVPALRAFWFEFDLPLDGDSPHGTREGIGVTASDLDEALRLVAHQVFAGRALPPLRAHAEDVEFHRLCPWLVLPNMADPTGRGIWYPAGYQVFESRERVPGASAQRRDRSMSA